MRTSPRHARAMLAVAIPLAAAPAACAQAANTAATRPTAGVVLDGDLSDWPADATAFADGHNLYLHIHAPADGPLQAGSATTAILLDLDDNPATGRPDGALGIDVAFLLSPPDPAKPGQLRRGAQGLRYAGAQAAVPLAQGKLGLVCLPTYAATDYEVRIDRLAPALRDAPSSPTGTIRVRIERRDADGRVLAGSAGFAVQLPVAADAEALAAEPPPAHEPDQVRILSWNVLWGTPIGDPAPFARVIRALDPDIVLVQEWDDRDRDTPRTTAKSLEDWFASNVPTDTPWRAVTSTERGAALITRHPVDTVIVSSLRTSIDADQRKPVTHSVRVVAAAVRTPLGEVAAASLHLKCCGTAGSSEDVERIGEAFAINDTLRRAFKDSPPGAIVVAGDHNLVGSRIPLETLIAGLNPDGSSLTPAPALVWGDASAATWRDPKDAFPPGRLDYISTGGAGASVVRAFILDTSRIDPSALARAGLERGDTAASDHLPVVVDLRLAPPPPAPTAGVESKP